MPREASRLRGGQLAWVLRAGDSWGDERLWALATRWRCRPAAGAAPAWAPTPLGPRCFFPGRLGLHASSGVISSFHFVLFWRGVQHAGDNEATILLLTWDENPGGWDLDVPVV